MQDSLQNIKVTQHGHQMPVDTTTLTIGLPEQTDSATVSVENHSIVISPLQKGHAGTERPESAASSSWILLALVILFFLVSLRYKNNFRYLKSIFNDLTDVRTRHNLFDDTVKETTFLVLLNLLCIVSVGILLFEWLSFSYPAYDAGSSLNAAISVGTVAVFYAFQYVAFWCSGNIFSDKNKTSMWLKGFSSSQGILGIVLFPIMLAGLFYPEYTPTITFIAAICFISARIIFICKGFRIFFTQTGSCVLFLYYLCNLEIVTVLLAYVAALKFM